MSESRPGEHWFDRLTTRLSRRSALKAGMLGAAALVLPVAWPAAASADIITEDCFTGCRWFEHKQFGAAKQACEALDTTQRVSEGFSLALTVLILPGAVIGNVAGQLTQLGTYQNCLDNAIVNAKVAAFDCYGPACNGFDPKQPGGPCDSCTENCCVCPDIPNGYICCFYACDDTEHNCCGS
jgi:hypothetical protein